MPCGLDLRIIYLQKVTNFSSYDSRFKSKNRNYTLSIRLDFYSTYTKSPISKLRQSSFAFGEI